MDQEQTRQAPPSSDTEQEAPARESTVERARRLVNRVPYGRRALVIGSVVVVLVLLVTGLQYFNSGTTQRGGRRGFGGATPVGSAKGAQGSMPSTLNALGTVTPLATVTVRPQVSGQLLK